MKKLVNLSILICAFIICMTCAVVGFSFTSATAANNAIKTHGASVRLVDPEGIRFLSSVSAEYKDCEVGTLIIPKSILGDAELNHNNDTVDQVSLNYKDIAKTKWSNSAVEQLEGFDYDASRYYFNAVLSGIPNTDYGTVLVARAYVVKDGQYVYGDVMERSIAQVAATSLLVDEENETLIDYVDTALAGKELSINATNSFIGIAQTQTFEIVNGNGYDAIWTVTDASIGSFDEQENGLFTAETEGTTTVNAIVGSTVVSSKITTGESLVGEKVTNFTADNYTKVTVNNSLLGFSEDITYNGEGVLAVTSNISSWKNGITLNNIDVTKYSTLSLKVYQQNGGSRLIHAAAKVNGNTTRLSEKTLGNGVWVEYSFDITSIDAATPNITLYFGTSGDDGNKGNVFYISNVYGVRKAESGKKVVDFTADNYATIATPNYSSLSYTEDFLCDGEGVVAVDSGRNWQNGLTIKNVDLTSTALKVYVYQNNTGNRFVKAFGKENGASSSTPLTSETTVKKGVWTEFTFDVTALNATFTADIILYFGTANENGSESDVFYISDIYAAGESRISKLVSMETAIGSTFNSGNTATTSVEYTTEGSSVLGSGVAKIKTIMDGSQAYGVFKSDVDLSGYSKITFKVYRPSTGAGGGWYLRIKTGSGAAIANSPDCSVLRRAGDVVEVVIDVNDLADKNLNYLYIQFGTTDTASGEKVNGTINTYILVSDIYGIK